MPRAGMAQDTPHHASGPHSCPWLCGIERRTDVLLGLPQGMKMCRGEAPG